MTMNLDVLDRYARFLGRRHATVALAFERIAHKKSPVIVQLGSYIFNANSRKSTKGEIAGNGLDSAIIRKGRRVFLLEQKLDEWFQGGGTR